MPGGDRDRNRRWREFVAKVSPGCVDRPKARAISSADETRLPVGGRAVVVIGLQGLRVILPIVAEECPAGVELAAVAQPVPETVADLVAEVTQQGAVGFVHGDAPLLAGGVIGVIVTRPGSSVASDDPVLAQAYADQDLAVSARLQAIINALNSFSSSNLSV